MKFITDKKNLYAIAFSVLFIFGALFFNDKKADAQLSPFTPFGGTISKVEYCCNGLILTVDSAGEGGQFGGDFFLNYYDIANPQVNYAYYQVFYGGEQPDTGIAFPVGFCFEIGDECSGGKVVRGGTIIKIGTGLPGGN